MALTLNRSLFRLSSFTEKVIFIIRFKIVIKVID